MGFFVLQGYGMTETAPVISTNTEFQHRFRSVGKLVPRVEARIVDPQPVEDGGPTAGEIALRGSIVMKGYWNRPEATAEVLRDGWLYTGDLGYFQQTLFIACFV